MQRRRGDIVYLKLKVKDETASVHQGQSTNCEHVVGINMNVTHGNHAKIIALISAKILGRDYPKASYTFLYLPLPPSDHS